jgi:hypothetical protein
MSKRTTIRAAAVGVAGAGVVLTGCGDALGEQVAAQAAEESTDTTISSGGRDQPAQPGADAKLARLDLSEHGFEFVNASARTGV